MVLLSLLGGAIILWRALRRRRSGRAGAPALARAALSAIDRRRRPPGESGPGITSVGGAVAALRRPAVPRPLPFVTIKRTNPRVGDTFGHWWIEVDGVESYGWWPRRCPLRIRDFLFGATGTVNGLGGSCAGGSSARDPRHSEPAQHRFHPVLTARKSDRRVRDEIRSFASTFAGEWRWSSKPTSNDCRTFQVRMMNVVGLVEPAGSTATRGRGCPFLALFGPRTRELA